MAAPKSVDACAERLVYSVYPPTMPTITTTATTMAMMNFWRWCPAHWMPSVVTATNLSCFFNWCLVALSTNFLLC